MGREAVIVSAVRTPFGAFQGALRDLSATDLGAVAIREALRRVELLDQPEEIDQVLMGQVVQAGAGQIPSRQAAHKAGLPFGVVSAKARLPRVSIASIRRWNRGGTPGGTVQT